MRHRPFVEKVMAINCKDRKGETSTLHRQYYRRCFALGI